MAMHTGLTAGTCTIHIISYIIGIKSLLVWSLEGYGTKPVELVGLPAIDNKNPINELGFLAGTVRSHADDTLTPCAK